jgi:lupus La protein
MWKLTGGEQNLAVKLKDICKFKRMHRFQPYSAVVAAMRDSKFLDISGADSEEEIKRKKPYISASGASQARLAATVYVKGFGDEEPTTQFDIEAFFARYGPVNSIRLRRTDDNLFKGSVFAEFQDEDQAKKFLELDPAPTWKEHDLKIMSKKAYVDEKTKLIQEGKIEASNNQRRFFEGKETGNRGGRGRGDSRRTDPNDWKKRRDEDQKNGFKDRHRGRGGRGGRGRGGRGGRGGRDSRQDRTEASQNE